MSGENGIWFSFGALFGYIVWVMIDAAIEWACREFNPKPPHPSVWPDSSARAALRKELAKKNNDQMWEAVRPWFMEGVKEEKTGKGQ